MKRLGLWVLLLVLTISLPLASCGPSEEPEEPDDPQEDVDPRYGGTLRVAHIGEPPSLDPHWTTAVITRTYAMHMVEQLFVFNADFEPVPFLVSDYDLSNDGLQYTLHLRQGVKFHNGQEMKAADVVASLQRWVGRSAVGRSAFRPLEEISAPDDYTVRITLSEPSGTVPFALANPGQFAGIMPKDIVERFGEGEVTEYVGTGPYQFVEWLPDRHIRIERFADYWGGPDEEPSGLAGRRAAYVDEIVFLSVPDESVRIAGVETGEYDFAAFATLEEFDRLEAHPSVITNIVKPRGYTMNVFNTVRPPFDDVRMRRAVNAAQDQEPIMIAGHGHPAFFRLDPCLIFKETPWHTTQGQDRYDLYDVELSRKLQEEAGYQGETIRLMTTREYEQYYKKDVVVEEQLRAAGMGVDLKVVDWATLISERGDPDNWEIFSTGIVLNMDPVQNLFLPSWTGWPGWYESDPMDELLIDLFYREVEWERRYAVWERVMDLFWDELPVIKHGDYHGLNILNARVKEYHIDYPFEFFANVWLERD